MLNILESKVCALYNIACSIICLIPFEIVLHRAATKFADCNSPKPSKHRIFFEDPKGKGKIKFDGCPYIILGRKFYECQHGVDRHAKDKTAKAKKVCKI